MQVLAAAAAHDMSPTRRPRLARVAVLQGIATARRTWEDLAERVPCSPYQRPAWLVPWLDTLGGGAAAVFVVGYDAEGRAIALLPLCLRRLPGFTLAGFPGGHDANTGLGLFDPAALLDRAAIENFLQAAAAEARIDLFVLRHQPHEWAGTPNPLAILPQAASPSFQHLTELRRPAEAFLAQTLSKRTRKHIRQKETKLAALGPVAYEVATTAEQVAAFAEALVRYRATRFGGRRGHEALVRRFLERSGLPEGNGAPAVELHALTCGGDIVAVFAGTGHQGRFSGMMISFDPDPRWAKLSPGELLLARVIASKCDAGFKIFDLGIGEARYKDVFCPVVEPLFDTIRGASWRGRLAAPAWRVHLAGKRAIKRTPWLWSRLSWLRSVTRFARR
ncbi:GNAT family N-acetyltransferase [Lichenifustis flavocetrariae]|uniref:GNAT family N-acetyltransferase n=1 Tax=Lichenifustis flavocetrariae TaxID=2949735 RepID=A0AA41YXI3_9HYPH|nr:GNAT family N-acetyltransferase [Lichenifustis flavocetrariae]MCW6510401.1 GNAT family N-acetyltransferase [Lichenifustis flavocetrariae]